MKKLQLALAMTALATAVVVGAAGGPSQAGPTGRFSYQAKPGRPSLSGAADASLLTRGTTQRYNGAEVRAALATDDYQVNGDNKRTPTQQFGSGLGCDTEDGYGGETCGGFPQNETAIAVNPTDQSNVIAGANDYEPAVDAVHGIYVSFDGGNTYTLSRFAPQVITPDRDMYGSGDPVIAFDRDGVAYAAFISFGREHCDSYIAVSRSTDKGVTWSAPVVDPPGGTHMIPGDGIVAHNGGPADCRIFHDKEWMATGPRPAGVPLVAGTDPRFVSRDRLYVTWTRFNFGADGLGYVESPIFIAYSDDEGRNWSSPKQISGRSSFCHFQLGDKDTGMCDEDQFSVPVADPRTGQLFVAFENFNHECCSRNPHLNQYMIVRSNDGGATFSNPTMITKVHDGPGKYPVCAGSQTLDFMCARTNAAGNVDIDPSTGDLYLVWADNRNGTATNTNTDVLVKRSTDGGRSWSVPTNITKGALDDQWFPWLDINDDGVVGITYFDRRYSNVNKTQGKLINTSLSVSFDAGNTWTTKRVSEAPWNPDYAFRLGIFIGDYNGLALTDTTALPFWTDARFGNKNEAANNPPTQQSDVMTDVEPLAAYER